MRSQKDDDVGKKNYREQSKGMTRELLGIRSDEAGGKRMRAKETGILQKQL